MDNNCLICERITLIKENSNPYFVKELKIGFVAQPIWAIDKSIRKAESAKPVKKELEFLKNQLSNKLKY